MEKLEFAETEFSAGRIETNYKRWLICSPGARDYAAIYNLYKSVHEEESRKAITLTQKSDAEGPYFFISEEGNPFSLLLPLTEKKPFLEYLREHYILYDNLEEWYQAKSKGIQLSKGVIVVKKVERISADSQGTGEKAGSFSIFTLLNKISRKSKLLHAINFSLLGFILVQWVILPQYFGFRAFKEIMVYVSLGTILLVSYLCVETYTRRFSETFGYWKIFRMVVLCCSLFFIWHNLENFIIDVIKMKISTGLFYILFFLLELMFGAFIGLLVTAVVFILKGGKINDVR